MSDFEKGFLPFRRRVRLARAWRGFAIGGMTGGLLAALLAALDLFGLFYTEWLWLGLVVAGCACLGALSFALLPVTQRALADSIDRRAGLQDRLSTASEETITGSFAEPQAEDAAKRLAEVKPAELYPIKLGRWHAGALGLAALAAMVFLLGNSAILMNDQQKKDREELQKAASAVERIAKPVAEDKPFGDKAEEKRLLDQMELLKRDLERGRIPKEQALQDANELAKKAEELTKKRFEQVDQSLMRAENALQKLADEKLSKNGQKLDPSQMKPSDMYPSDMKHSEMSGAEAEKRIQELDAQIKKLEEQLAKQGGSMSSEQRENLKKQIQELKLSKEAQETFRKLMESPEMKEILEMMKKLQEGANAAQMGEQQPLTQEQIEEMQRRLEELAKRLQNPEEMKKFLEELKKSLEDAKGG